MRTFESSRLQGAYLTGEHAGAMSELRGQVDLEAQARAASPKLAAAANALARPIRVFPGLRLPQGGQQDAAERQLVLDHHRHRVGAVLFQQQPGVHAGARHPRAARQHPRGEAVRAGRGGRGGGAGEGAPRAQAPPPPTTGPPSPSSAAGATWPRWSSTERTSTRGSRCGSGTWRRRPCTGTGWGGQPPSGRWV